MSSNLLTQMLSSFRWVPSPNVKRRFYLTPTCLVAFVATLAICFTTEISFAQKASQYASDQVVRTSVAPNDSLSNMIVSPNASTPRTNVLAQTNQSEVDRPYPAVTEPVRNERCVQKTFRAPTDKNAALIGSFLLHLLPSNLKEQTSWRYDEDANTLTMYGPEKAIELSEALLNDFSEPLFEAFLTSGEFVGVAGVLAPPKPEEPVEQALATQQQPSEKYYDPERNEVVRVAYEAEGAVMPEREEYAVTFGGGNSPENAPVPNVPANDDGMLDVVSYRCLPSMCDRVEQIAKQQFASNPEIAFSVDRRLGTIVVHTNRKLQREVQAFFATFKIYPSNQSAETPDLRLATGVVTAIDGVDDTGVQRAARQVYAGNQTNAEQGQNAEHVGMLDDVYQPQYRKAAELQDALLQLFGERLQRQATNDKAAFSARQVVTYRFTKRQYAEEEGTVPSMCEIVVDSLHNQIAVQGDSALCEQMLVLLRAMDQPPLRNGNVRRFIPIRNGDSRKLQQIFEYDSPKTTRYSRPATLKVAVDQFSRGTLDKATATEDQVARFAQYFTDQTSYKDLVSIQQGVEKTSPQTANKLLTSLCNATEALAQTSSVNSGVRQVSYQDGDLPQIDEAPVGAPSDFDEYAVNRRNGVVGGVGVVQGFMPIVLPGIDVVIVDNATDAEFERIKQMIEQIEELAKIAEISTEIYNLQHVDCTMLHGVLSTLYEEMFTTKQGRVVFYSLQNPNAILVAGWGQAFNDMKKMIELFDQPIEEGAGTMRVVRLKYASADEIAALLTDTFITPQTTGTGGLAPRIRAFADVRTNSLIIQAAPNDWKEIEKILLELDVNKTETKLVTRVFQLKNSLAENLRTTIMNAILPAKQGTLDTSAAKFPVLELLSVDDSGRRLVESGVMMDVDVTADVYHNQLIVNAPEDCMEFMERLIEILDVAPKKAQIRFFQVRHGDAEQIMQTLQSLLASSDENLSTPTLPQAEGEETFVPVRFAIDTRTNVIIAAAAPRELAIIDALIVALDVKDTAEREEEVVQLRNIQAVVVAQAIDDYLSQKQALETTSEVLSNYQLYESQIIVIPESISNSIIVSAAPENMDKILDMIKEFDKDPPQVVIQVLIAEVTLSNQEEFGIETGLQDATSFDRSLVTTTSAGTTGKPGFDIIGGGGPGQNMVGTDPTHIAGQVLNNFGLGSNNASLGYGGFVLSASSRSIDVTLRALREKNRLQVLSRPQVTAMDNQQAFILVGQRVPRINGTTTTNYGVQMNTTDTPVGLILLVTPRVTQDGKVVMEIGAEKSSLGNDSDATPIYSQDGEVIKSKSIDTIQAMTAISARDGETVMLGGLLTSTKEKISRGVPYLSDVPLLGWFFRYDQEIVQRKELLIVMTPHIMRNSADYHEAMTVEMGRTTIDLEEAMKINGNMGLYDPKSNQGCVTKDTERLGYKLIHPDRMDELKNIPDYSPSRDYAPRDPNSYQQPARRSNRTTSTQTSTSEARDQYSWSSSLQTPEKSTSTKRSESVAIPAVMESNEEFELLNDDFTDDFSATQPVQRTRAKNDDRAVPERVAMREPSRQRQTPQSSSSQTRQTRSLEKAPSSTTSSKTQRATGISSYRKPKTSSSTNKEDERVDVQTRSIRGQVQEETSPTFLPLSKVKENSKVKLFHWTSL